MTTILISKKEKDSNNVVILDLVELDNEKFFHIHGYNEGKRIEHKVYLNETDYALDEASFWLDNYISIFDSK